MGDAVDPVFERKVRREVWLRYKSKAAAFQQVYAVCQRQEAKIRALEMQIAEMMDLAEMAERIISDGTVSRDDESRQCSDTAPAVAGKEDHARS